MASKKKSSSKSKTKSKDILTKRALKLIDEAAELLKEGVIMGARQGSKSKAALKRNAYALADSAIKRLDKAVKKGGVLIRKGIKKI